MRIDYDLKHTILLKMWQNKPKMIFALSTYQRAINSLCGRMDTI